MTGVQTCALPILTVLNSKDFILAIRERLIDYCCHGNITIGEAVKKHRLSGDFLKELQDAYEAYRNRPDKTESVADMSTEDLIRLIIDTHHIPERQLWVGQRYQLEPHLQPSQSQAHAS